MEGLNLKQLIERELQINEFPPEWWNLNKDAEIERLYNTLYDCDNFRRQWRSYKIEDAEAGRGFIEEVITYYRLIKPLFLKGLQKYHVPYAKRYNNLKQRHDTSEAIKVLENSDNAIIRILCNNKSGAITKWCVEDENGPLWFEDDYGMTTEFFGSGGNVREYLHDTKRYKQVRETLLGFLYAQQGVYRFHDKYMTKAVLRRLNDRRRSKRLVECNRKRGIVKVCSEFYGYLLQSNIKVWETYNGAASNREGEVKDFISDVLGEKFSESFRRAIKKKFHSIK